MLGLFECLKDRSFGCLGNSPLYPSLARREKRGAEVVWPFLEWLHGGQRRRRSGMGLPAGLDGRRRVSQPGNLRAGSQGRNTKLDFKQCWETVRRLLVPQESVPGKMWWPTTGGDGKRWQKTARKGASQTSSSGAQIPACLSRGQLLCWSIFSSPGVRSCTPPESRCTGANRAGRGAAESALLPRGKPHSPLRNLLI